MPQTSSVGRSVGACLLVGALTAWASFAVHAQPSPAEQPVTAGRTWVSLTRAQQDALRPLQPEWHAIEPARKAKWIEVADRMPRMQPDDRARVQQRMAEWARMTPAQRGQARANYRQAQQVPPEDRKARWEAYKALPPERQEELAERAAAARAASRVRESARGGPPGRPANTPVRPQVVAPSVTQAGPGATTNLVARRPLPPPHQQPGATTVSAGATLVDSKTLLPKRGPQAAARSAPPASAAARTAQP